MHIQFKIKNLNDAEKAYFEEYATKRLQTLQKWVKGLSEDETHLEAHIEKFATKEAYKVVINFKVRGKSFYASEDDHTIEEAVDKTKDKIKIQILKEKDKSKSL